MRAKVLGFLGGDSYDLVYYLSRMGFLLGKDCAVVDYSGLGVAELITKGDCSRVCVDCRGVDYYSCSMPVKEYDYIFLYFDRKMPVQTPCERMYMVLDGQLHEAKRLLGTSKVCAPSMITVLRSAGWYGRNVNSFMMEVGNLEWPEVQKIDFSAGDAAARLSIGYCSVPNLSGISYSVRKFVRDFYALDFQAKETARAMRSLLRGR